ncbi:MAG: M28 family peptidase [Sphingobacteriales bacterium]|nr:M28 family peptidase [Sphingobacteriales bacterium]OJW32296.1 MAG: hypothetical protein BGO54_17990 [Sphingobacteriales bacterium 46-32]
MNLFRVSASLLLLLTVQQGLAQKLKKADKLTLANLRSHIGLLADDKLEGRRTGTPGEKQAMEYISAQFSALGIAPKGSNEYYQAFEVNEGKKIDPSTFFSVNGTALTVDKDFFPLPYSAGKAVEAQPAIALQEADMPWFVNLRDVLEENRQNPHFDVQEYIRNNARKAFDKAATAIILYNTSDINDQLRFDGKDKSATLPLPVIYVKKEAATRFFNDPTASLQLKLNVKLAEAKRTGYNVVGYIDNGAPSTVVLGAHYDHLGYGEDGNSMLRTGEHLIHNGADDNASGTAALIELGRILKSSKSKNSNYLLLAFSGEELGLYGSKYYTENPTVDLKSVNYMINMDMIGRLSDSTHTLAIGGYGTSATWSTVINPQEKKLPFAIKLDSSGTGPSDHTSFYRKDIPVLFFFTGQHKDYHRPTDDADRINYEGELHIVNYISNLIAKLDKQNQKLGFLKTREEQARSTAFKVTLGIMPDYTYSGNGLRADGVTDGRPAARAGLKAGDVITQIGDHKVSSVESYMQALGKFNKGEKTVVKFKRGNTDMQAEVQF